MKIPLVRHLIPGLTDGILFSVGRRDHFGWMIIRHWAMGGRFESVVGEDLRARPIDRTEAMSGLPTSAPA